MEAIVTLQKAFCHSSVLILAMAQVNANKTMTKIKLINNLGVVLNLCPKTALSNKKVTLGIMEAIDMLGPQSFWTSSSWSNLSCLKKLTRKKIHTYLVHLENFFLSSNVIKNLIQVINLPIVVDSNEKIPWQKCSYTQPTKNYVDQVKLVLRSIFFFLVHSHVQTLLKIERR